MNTENAWVYASITPAQIDAVVRQARADRAKAMREAIRKVPGLLKRLIAAVRPNRPRGQRAWA